MSGDVPGWTRGPGRLRVNDPSPLTYDLLQTHSSSRPLASHVSFSPLLPFPPPPFEDGRGGGGTIKVKSTRGESTRWGVVCGFKVEEYFFGHSTRPQPGRLPGQYVQTPDLPSVHVLVDPRGCGPERNCETRRDSIPSHFKRCAVFPFTHTLPFPAHFFYRDRYSHPSLWIHIRMEVDRVLCLLRKNIPFLFYTCSTLCVQCIYVSRLSVS